MNPRQTVIALLGVWTLAHSLFITPSVEADLSPSYYDDTCPEVYAIVGAGVAAAILNETRNAASLVRLHFHDCFVQGCDGSDLLDTPADGSFVSEKTSLPNLHSLRAFDVVDAIKEDLESICPGVVSCADILALSAFFSVVLTGGPLWWVPLGRLDSLTANSVLSANNLPAPFFNIAQLKNKFENQNLSVTDLVALSGAHTFGIARCVVVAERLYTIPPNPNPVGIPLPDPTLPPAFLKTLEKSCPNVRGILNGSAGNVTNPLDLTTPQTFDNQYYKNLLASEGLLFSDMQLYLADNTTKALVELYASSKSAFFDQFAASMINMGNILPPKGTPGEVRTNCRVVNSAGSSIKQKSGTRVEQAVEGGFEVFEKSIRKIVTELVGEPIERLVEDTISASRSSF